MASCPLMTQNGHWKGFSWQRDVESATAAEARSPSVNISKREASMQLKEETRRCRQ